MTNEDDDADLPVLGEDARELAADGLTNTANCWRKFANKIPMNTSEIGPGHHATKPAKNPQNGPRTLWVQT